MSNKNTNLVILPFGEHPEPQKQINYSCWEPVYNYDSTIKNLVLTKEQRNTQEEINAYLDGTRIYDILDKYVGVSSNNFADIPELNKKSGMYVDITNLPDNLHDLHKLSQKAKEQLNVINSANNETQTVNQKDINQNSQVASNTETQKSNKAVSETNKETIKGDK